MKLLLALTLALVGFAADANAATCKEGTEMLISENDHNDRSVRVLYVCKSGRWVAPYKKSEPAAKPVVCKDGDEFTTWENNSGNDGGSRVTYVCKAGKWYNPYAAPKSTEPAYTPAEGSEIRVLETDEDGRSSWVVYVFTNGRYVKKY